LNQHAKYLGQRSFRSTAIVQVHRHTHLEPTALPCH